MTERAREERPDVLEKRRLASASPRGQANKRKYQATPKGKATMRQRRANRRARELAAMGVVTAEDWIAILQQHKHRCFYCKTRRLKLTMDHVIPLSRGGTHTKENIVPACQPCNSKKSAKIILLC
jgi:5-methylcytosine-specific restriction endonuclease McrA